MVTSLLVSTLPHLPQQVRVLLVAVHHMPGVELLYQPLDPGHQVRQRGGQEGLWTQVSVKEMMVVWRGRGWLANIFKAAGVPISRLLYRGLKPF